MASLMDTLLSSLLSGESVDAMTQKTGASNDQVKDVVGSALPVLLQSMANNASNDEGASSLAKALSQHATTKAPAAEQVKNADTADGAKILGHLLGGKTDLVQDQLAEKSGLSSSQVGTLLSSLAPVLLNQVGQEAKPEENNSSGLGDLITSLVTGKSSDKSQKSVGENVLGGILDFALNKDDSKSGSGNNLLSSLIGLLTGK